MQLFGYREQERKAGKVPIKTLTENFAFILTIKGTHDLHQEFRLKVMKL